MQRKIEKMSDAAPVEGGPWGLAGFDPDAPLERAETPPASWYRSREIFERERESVLAPGWHPVACAAQLQASGAYVATELWGEPLVLVRDHEGVLRAFHNVCSHHGAQIARGTGHCEALTCPYHGWVYNLDGRLQKARGAGGLRALGRARLDLAPVAVGVWGGLVFACTDDPPEPLETALAEISDSIWDSPAGRLRFVARREYTLACNWKVFVDNYLDGGYHVGVVHAALASGLALEAYRTDLGERVVRQTVPAPASRSDRRIGTGALYVWLYPTFMLNRYGPILDTNHVIPIDAEHTRVVFDFFFAPDAAEDKDFVASSIAESDHIQREDATICERVQSGLRSRAYTRGRYAPHFEAGMHLFHCLLARDLSLGAGEG